MLLPHRVAQYLLDNHLYNGGFCLSWLLVVATTFFVSITIFLGLLRYASVFSQTILGHATTTASSPFELYPRRKDTIVFPSYRVPLPTVQPIFRPASNSEQNASLCGRHGLVLLPLSSLDLIQFLIKTVANGESSRPPAFS